MSALEASMKESIAMISHQRAETQKTSSTMMVMSAKQPKEMPMMKSF